jgi:hypothetical protein
MSLKLTISFRAYRPTADMAGFRAVAIHGGQSIRLFAIRIFYQTYFLSNFLSDEDLE